MVQGIRLWRLNAAPDLEAQALARRAALALSVSKSGQGYVFRSRNALYVIIAAA